MAEFRVPTVALSAEVLCADGRSLVGRIFVPASASRHSGAMRSEEWMNEAVEFFPFLEDGSASSVILNKRQVLVLSLAASPQDDEPEDESRGATTRQVKLRCGDRDFEGTVRIEMPEGQSRLLDYLNRPDRFLGLWDGQSHRLVQKLHLTRVQEFPEG